MRIVIDLQGAQTESRFRGIGRYSLSFSLALARIATDHELCLIVNDRFPESILEISRAFEGLVSRERIRVFKVPLMTRAVFKENKWRMQAAELIREKFILDLNPDILIITSLFEGYFDDAVTSVHRLPSKIKIVACLYDLIPFLDPKTYLPKQTHSDFYYKKLDSLKNIDLLLAISESSKKEAVEGLGIPGDGIVNISSAVDANFCPIDISNDRKRELYDGYGIEREFILYAPGGFDKRKNLDRLMKAYSLLPENIRLEYQLVIVSSISHALTESFKQKQKMLGLSVNDIVFTGHLSSPVLVEFYNMASLFVFPSTHEGFGLPVLEAMACGTPTIGSNVTSIPEVIELSEAMFDPYSPKEIQKILGKGLTDISFRERLIANGKAQVSKFSWQLCAEKALEALEQMPKTRESLIGVSDTEVEATDVINEIAKIEAQMSPSERDLCDVASSLAFNIRNISQQRKTLFLDVSVIVHGDAKSGIQRVVRSILLELLRCGSTDYDIKAIYFDVNKYRYASKFTASMLDSAEGSEEDSVVEFSQSDVYLALDLNAHLTQKVHPFHRYLQCIGVKMYFIVYDLLLIHRPDWWPAGTSDIFLAWLESITKVATGLICISKSVQREVEEWIQLNPSEGDSNDNLVVSYFHLGSDIENSAPSKGIPESAGFVLDSLSMRQSFLMVGTIEPRKGHALVLDSFDSLWANGSDVGLIIVGKEGWLCGELINRVRLHSELGKRLFWLESISDEYLVKIYDVSACLIAASEGEGFGLPLIEAARHELPIIARDIPVFREVAGQQALYFGQTISNSLEATVLSWLSLYENGKHPKSEAIRWLTWKESTQQLLQSIVY